MHTSNAIPILLQATRFNISRSVKFFQVTGEAGVTKLCRQNDDTGFFPAL
jgi:hypothetical protein